MRLEDLTELQIIVPIENMASVMVHGWLCHKHAQRFNPRSVADDQIQAKRVKKIQGRPLHEFANLYFHARNPMMYTRKNIHKELCVLRVDTSVLELPGVVISDSNCASEYVGFYPFPYGLSRLDEELVFAKYWTSEDTLEYWRRKSAKLAEVLVPSSVDPEYFLGAYVSCRVAKVALENTGFCLPIQENGDLFFH